MLQLGITLTITIARSWVRRGLAVVLEHIKLTLRFELSEAAIYLSSEDLYRDIVSNRSLPVLSEVTERIIWELVTGGYTTRGTETFENNSNTIAEVNSRRRTLPPPPRTCPIIPSAQRSEGLRESNAMNHITLLQT